MRPDPSGSGSPGRAEAPVMTFLDDFEASCKLQGV